MKMKVHLSPKPLTAVAGGRMTEERSNEFYFSVTRFIVKDLV